MNTYGAWYDLVEWLNSISKDKQYPPRAVAVCAYMYLVEYRCSLEHKRATSYIESLLSELFEEGSETAEEYIKAILKGIR